MSTTERKGTKIKERTLSQVDLEACLAGDEGAWRRLMQEYGPLLRKAVRWVLRQRAAKNSASSLEADTEDVVQEVCFRLLRSEYRLLKTYDPVRSSFGTWLCVVARSAALDHLRNRRLTQLLSPEELDNLAASHEQYDGVLSLPRDLLTPRQAYVLHLAYEKDASTREIAELMDLHPQTIRSMRNNALARLRWHYAGSGDCKAGIKVGARSAKDAQRKVIGSQYAEIA